MKFIKPSFEILDIPEPTDHMGVLKHLEKIGRVCYKSEEKITDESCIKFLQNIRNRKHWAMLEHYIFVMSIHGSDYEELCNTIYSINEENPDLAEKIRFIHITCWDDVDYTDDRKFLVSGSATAFNYLWACNMFKDGGRHIVNRICNFLHSQYPEIMNVPETIAEVPENTARVLDSYGIRFLSRDEIKSLPIGLRKIHDFASVKSITDRGVTHEDVRHRPASWAQESTRYCNYGKLGCTFIIPCWFTDEESNILLNMTDNEFYRYVNTLSQPNGMSPAAWRWTADMMYLGSEYEKFVEPVKEKSESSEDGIEVFGDDGYGWTPQKARSILPNSIKTEIIMTANLNEWEHYFNMRVPRSAHPQMRELAVPMFVDFAQKDPDIFGEQMKKLEAEVQEYESKS